MEEKGPKWNKAKGNIKEGIGKMTGDESLKQEGRIDESVGRLQDKGNVREGDARDELERNK